MAVFKTDTLGDEQLIMLPVNPAEPVGYRLEPRPSHPDEIVGLLPGRHAIVVSGYAGLSPLSGNPPHTPGPICIAPPSTDDEIHRFDVRILVGPVWERLVQVSASASFASIISRDSDEVDHSQWILDGCTWEPARIAPNDPGNTNKRILLKVPCRVQGVSNCLYNFGYQVVATGDLYHLPTATEVSVDPSELIPPQ
jgi:hypothetical protein